MPKRVRIFAGPNGSGKSTIKKIVESKVKLGTYINADEIKVQLTNQRHLDFSLYGLLLHKDSFIDSLINSTWSKRMINVECALSHIYFENNCIRLSDSYVPDDYFVSFIASYIRDELLEISNKFTIETVMSHPSKLEFIKKAKEKGFKVYLYFVSLADPALNKHRVKTRVLAGGHDVDADKIEQRYYRTMNNLLAALKLVDDAYIFDNSNAEANMFAIKKDNVIEILGDFIPTWFNKYFIDKLNNQF
jgi:predicted ABC-type ATPase